MAVHDPPSLLHTAKCHHICKTWFHLFPYWHRLKLIPLITWSALVHFLSKKETSQISTRDISVYYISSMAVLVKFSVTDSWYWCIMLFLLVTPLRVVGGWGFFFSLMDVVFHRLDDLTFMLVVANLANTKWSQKPDKMTETLANGTHLRVLIKSFPMNTNMTGFRWVSQIFASLCFWPKKPQHW